MINHLKDCTIHRGEKLYDGRDFSVYEIYVLHPFESTITSSSNNNLVEVEYKSPTNSMISAMFRILEQNGVPTHFVCEGTNERSIIVRRTRRLGLKGIGRFIVTDECCQRYGLSKKFLSNKRFSNMAYEIVITNDHLSNQFISPSMAVELGFASCGDLNLIEGNTYMIGKFARKFFEKFDLTLVEFSAEFGYDVETNKVTVCDFSINNCTLWDKDDTPISKNFFSTDSAKETYKKIWETIENGTF